MLVIKENTLKQYDTNQHDKKIVENLYENNAIEALEIYKDGTDGYQVRAIIYDEHQFEIEISMNKQGHIQVFNCNTYVFRSERVYKLLILMMINKFKPEKFPFIYNSDKYLWKLELKFRENANATSSLIQSYKAKSSRELSEHILTGNHQIKAFLSETRGDLILKFKVGIPGQTLYMIKNIQTFLIEVTRASYLTYGKKLAFKHDEENFDNSSKALITFMRKIIANGLNQNRYDKHAIKELTLTNGIIDDFFAIFEDIPLTHRDFYLDKATEFPIILVEKFESYYRVKLKTKHRYLLGQNHLYHLDGHVLMRTTLDLAGKTAGLLIKLSRQGELIVHHHEFNDFYTYVLSDIKNFIQIEGIDAQIKTESQINIYADVDKWDQIYVKIVYHYQGQPERIGFDERNTELSLNAYKAEGYIASYSEVDTTKNIAFVKGDHFQIHEFVHRGLHYLKQYATVYISDALKQIGKKNPINLKACITIKNDLLAIDLNSIDIPREELAGVLASYRRKKKFHQLKNGERLYLDSDELEEVDKMLESYQIDPSKMKEGQINLDLFRAFSINERAESGKSLIDFNRSDLFKKIIKRFENIDTASYELAPRYNKLLRDYQKYGYQWLRTLSDYGFGGILADDMGLGKTLQVISLLDNRQEEGQVSLVVAPTSLILNWEDEVKKFTPYLTAISVYGTAKARKEIIAQISHYTLLITSYDYIRRDYELYKDIQFKYVILDEAQYIKNQKTKSALAVKALNSKHKLALTGTPIENSLAELWSIFDFLMPGYLFPYAYFVREYERPIVKELDEQKQLELKQLISPFILRRRKAEVLKELPDKIETTLPIEFNSEEKKLYLANLVQVHAALQDKMKMEQVNSIIILAMLTKLRQICCEPRVLYANIKTPSSKLVACMELIKQLRQSGKKILLFSSFTRVLELLHGELEKEGILHYTLTGATDKVHRRKLVEQFQEDKTDVFLISLKAGGTGLNLTAAEAVIHFDPWWNMSAQNQATDRAHRIGQENTVQVFKLIMKDSVEENIQRLQEAKKGLADAFVEENSGAITSMSKENILALFKKLVELLQFSAKHDVITHN